MKAVCDVGLIGLAVMGQNLVLNLESRGLAVAVFNRTTAKTQKFAAERGAGKKIFPAQSIAEFCALLKPPRRIVLMVQAGAAVDEMIANLTPHLEPGDLIADGGNSRFQDTERRERELAQRGRRFLGLGISGGEEGALKGPAIMAGGSPEAYALLAPALTAIAAKVDGDPCAGYLGPAGAGHLVKMVHNGIEYGFMQLIAEIYGGLADVCRLPITKIAETFADWNRAELGSYLIEITADILRNDDPETGRPLVEVIMDRAREKGTGRWTVETALELNTPVPIITAAVEARAMSARRDERLAASKILVAPEVEAELRPDPGYMIKPGRAALHAAQICVYAQGFALLREASRSYHYGLKLDEVARVWRGGCIIRARLLEAIRAAFSANPELENLLLDPALARAVLDRRAALVEVVSDSAKYGSPAPGLAAALAYLDSYRSPRLPANLIQAQRDYFGAHTFERLDQPGSFHHEWKKFK